MQCAFIWFCVNIMGHDHTATLWYFGNSLIKVHGVSFHMIKCNWIYYKTDKSFRTKYKHDQDNKLWKS